ncbi:MAG: TonB family protein [Deltaproteobacteria bacterium]|nr:TonB family protein [Deltaproteobacteria bacterium]
MQSVLNQIQPGFSKMLFASFILHLIILTAGLFIIKGKEKKIFFAPVYTTVEIVESPAGNAGALPQTGNQPASSQPSMTEPARGAIKTEVVKEASLPAKTAAAAQKVAKHKQAEKKPTVVLPEKTLKAGLKPERAPDKASVEKAIASLEKKMEKRGEEELVSQRIKGIEERRERKTGDEVASIKKGLGEAGADTARQSSLTAYGSSSTAYQPSSTVSVTSPAKAAGSGRGGITRETIEIRFKDYYNALQEKIHSVWIYPGEARRDINTIVSMRILRSGELKSVWVEKKSGDTLFDESAVKAVKKASPYPPLPTDLKDEFLEVGVRFCPGGCAR